MNKYTLTVFGSLVLLKLVLLAIFGPVMTPDSAGYSGVAQTILSTNDWMHDAGLTQSVMPPFAFRIIGYPAFLAAVMAVAGSAWAYAAVCIQLTLSLYASWMTLRLGDELGLSRPLSLLAVVLYSTSLQLLLDQCILTDSLNASCIIIAIVLLVQGTRSGQPLSLAAAVSAGLLLAAAFLMREIMQAVIWLFVLFLVVRIACAKPGLRMRTLAIALIVLVLPLAAMQGYRQWNVYRTGQSFVTTGGQTAMLQGIATVAKRHPDILSEDSLLDRTLRKEFHSYFFNEVLTINSVLFSQGYTALDISRMATARYLAAWREHPVAMLTLLGTVSESQTRIAVRTFTAICEILEWGGNESRCYDYRDLYRGVFKAPMKMTTGEIATLLAMTAQNLLSLVVFAAFLIGVPFLVIAAGRWNLPPLPPATRMLLAAFWAVYCGFDLAYVLIHFESRYLAPVAPLCTFAGLFVVQETALRRWRRIISPSIRL